MSNIYIQEPPTSGKVLLITSCGEIDIELWSKEAPKACRNFIQLCLEGYYEGTSFHRVVKDFIVQGGDPTGTGHGGDSVYGKPFRDEFHSRLRFVRRGLVAMANAGPHDNGSQFFFTLGATPELNNKHTVFGKVAGNTVYNMLRLADCETDGEDRPLYPPKIKKTKVLSNPFDDIVPRSLPKSNKEEDEGKKKKSKSKATKNFSLLSFGEEAEEDEQEVIQASKVMKGKSKSSHDLLHDEKLSSVPALENAEADKKRKKDEQGEGEENTDSSEDEERKEQRKENVRKKLKKETLSATEVPVPVPVPAPVPVPEPEKKPEDEPKKNDRTEELKREIRQLKKEIMKVTKKQAAANDEKSEDEKEAVKETEDASDTKEAPVKDEPTDVFATFKEETQKYKEKRKTQTKKGSDRESQTLALLAKFQNKLTTVRKLASDYDDDEEEEEEKSTEKQEEAKEPEKEEDDEEEDPNDMSWMSHKLQFDEEQQRKVLDANITDIDRYAIFDPRNPMNQRRREASKNVMKDKR